MSDLKRALLADGLIAVKIKESKLSIELLSKHTNTYLVKRRASVQNCSVMTWRASIQSKWASLLEAVFCQVSSFRQCSQLTPSTLTGLRGSPGHPKPSSLGQHLTPPCFVVSSLTCLAA